MSAKATDPEQHHADRHQDQNDDQDDDGVVVVLTEEVPEGEVEHAREAVKLCPASALKLVD